MKKRSTVYFNEDAQTWLRLAAALRDKSQTDLLNEAIKIYAIISSPDLVKKILPQLTNDECLEILEICDAVHSIPKPIEFRG